MSIVPARFWRNVFWRRWVVANAFGELAGLGVVALTGFFVFRYAGEPSRLSQVLAFAGGFVLLGGIEGAVIGLVQQRVLRTLVPSIHGWIHATVIGAMVAWVVGMIPSTLATLMQQDATAATVPTEPPLYLVLLLAAGLGAVAGPMLAAFQWLSLRKALARGSWLWLPANAAAWALGMPVIFLGAQANELTSSVPAIAVLVALSIFICGAVVGAVHGCVLLGMVQRVSRDDRRA